MADHTISAAADQLRPSNLARGRGRMQLLKLPQPAAGASFTRVIPADYWERFLTLCFTLTNSATAGGRTAVVNYMDGDNNIFNQTQIAQGLIQSTITTEYGDLQTVSATQGGTSVTATGSVTSPGAGAAIATLNPGPAGTYFIYVTFNLAGTVAQGADANNLRLTNGGTINYANLDNSIATTPQQFGPIEIEIPAGGGIQLIAIGAGTVGSIYSATVTAVPIANQGSFTMPDIILKSGMSLQIAVGNMQAGDQLSGIFAYVERFPSGDYQVPHSEDILWELAALVGSRMGG